MSRNFFHIHLVSDSTGETLLTVARAVTVQYEGISAIEHIYPLVRTKAQLEKALDDIESAPGIVLYTLVDQDLNEQLEETCRNLGVPFLSVLSPVHSLLQSYLGTAATGRSGAQHVLNAEYFKRIEAMNFTLLHDDGHLPDDIEQADIILLGVSRTSKTPTSIYLANRGLKTANIPLILNVPIPEKILQARRPLIVGLVATPERIVQIRQNRLLSLNADEDTDYVDRDTVAEEISESRRLFARNNWPIIDVTRRSIEETAAAIIEKYRERRMQDVAI
ncbi:pyruvate, water dikinase regulatory protein [Microvirga sp. W0021]|uniref:Putative pyruvate, phosphate dikinase regulatory protein n=1 Tax=Hohaiivirga grylli TaxID=3133970 RepID=A0ABV0BF68_9HYPH